MITQSKVFYPLKKDSSYLFDASTGSSEVIQDGMALPLAVDTEFTSKHPDWTARPQSGRIGIYSQFRGYTPETPSIVFAHPGIAHLLPAMPIARSDFHPLDYLRELGYNVVFKTYDGLEEIAELPVLHIYLYGHFVLADAMPIVSGKCFKDFLALFSETSTDKPRFEMKRRLMAVSPSKWAGDNPYVDLAWEVVLNDVRYRVRLSFIDTAALHGQAKYKDLCEATNIEIPYKGLFEKEDMSNFLKLAVERHQDSVNYASGDLYVIDVLQGNAENLRNVYAALNILEYYQEPKLTIGATVKNLFTAKLQSDLGFESGSKEWKKYEKKYLAPSSAQELRKDTKRTSALLSKVVGGRCRNNRPLTAKTARFLVDMDVCGAYGEGQRNQLFTVGKPEIWDYPADSTVNDYITLKEYLKLYRKDLVPGCWFAIVKTRERLTIPQDFVASWTVGNDGDVSLMAKYVQAMVNDSENESLDIDFNMDEGQLKIFLYEIQNGHITHEFLQWLDNVCPQTLRKELLEKVVIIASMVYPASLRCESQEDFLKAQELHTGRNTVTRVAKGFQTVIRRDDGECHAWFAVPMGSLIINELMANRKVHKKGTALNTAFKLCINTLYGDMVSKYFTIANVCVGNNITARCRAVSWYMEKGLYGFETITDGCGFELNRVVYPRNDKRVTSTEVTNYYRKEGDRKANIFLAPLGDAKNIDLQWVDYAEGEAKHDKDDVKKVRLVIDFSTGEQQILEGEAAFDWVNIEAMKHLQKLFPGIDVLNAESTGLKCSSNAEGKAVYQEKARTGQFGFEAKHFYNEGAFHGTGNYLFISPNKHNLKMRSYEKKQHDSVVFIDDKPVKTERYGKDNDPAKDFLYQLLENPRKITRQETFVKQGIVKVNDYKKNVSRYRSQGTIPGDSYNKSGLLKEFSLSQFTFQYIEQLATWEKQITRQKDKYGQSIETYFLNDDGTLDFQSMIETVDKMICDGILSPFEHLDKQRKKKQAHPAHYNHQEAKAWLMSGIDAMGTLTPKAKPKAKPKATPKVTPQAKEANVSSEVPSKSLERPELAKCNIRL